MPAPERRMHASTSLSEINITPFVDVVLVLLIIFMITAPVLQSGIEVDLPKTRTVKVVSQERAVVTIDRGQRLYVNDRAVNINQVGEELRARGYTTEQGIYIRCDESVPFGVFAQVMDALMQAGFQGVNVVTEPLREGRRR